MTDADRIFITPTLQLPQITEQEFRRRNLMLRVTARTKDAIGKEGLHVSEGVVSRQIRTKLDEDEADLVTGVLRVVDELLQRIVGHTDGYSPRLTITSLQITAHPTNDQ
jgi:hypothetical protein